MSDPYGPPPEVPRQPGGELTQDDRTWALVAHVGSLVSAYVALGFLAPLLVMLVKGDSSPFARRHAVESLNFQISLLIYSVVGAVVGVLLTLFTFGLALFALVPLALVLALVALAFIVIATMKASRGEDYRYPLTIRLVS